MRRTHQVSESIRAADDSITQNRMITGRADFLRRVRGLIVFHVVILLFLAMQTFSANSIFTFQQFVMVFVFMAVAFGIMVFSLIGRYKKALLSVAPESNLSANPSSDTGADNNLGAHAQNKKDHSHDGDVFIK